MPRGKRSHDRVPLLAELEERDLLEVREAARLLGKSPQSIYRYLEEGRLGGRWYVHRDAVDLWWERGLVEQTKPDPY